MRTFFYGWRRKMGVFTLMMACVLTGGWVRSLNSTDTVTIRSGAFTYECLASIDGRLGWLRSTEEREDSNDPELGLTFPKWKSTSFRSGPDASGQRFAVTLPDSPGFLVGGSFFEAPSIRWQWRWCGFGAGTVRLGWVVSSGWQIDFLVIPYWSVALPLTVLATYLILWKSQKRVGSDR
ncbi:MAG TPA: hypothetical protein VGM98_13775 [Schlesneria sp.]